MDKAAVVERLREVISDVLGVALSDIGPDDRLVDDLGADKLEEFELADALEEEFDIEVDQQDMEAQVTVADLVQLVVDLRGDLDEEEGPEEELEKDEREEEKEEDEDDDGDEEGF